MLLNFTDYRRSGFIPLKSKSQNVGAGPELSVTENGKVKDPKGLGADADNEYVFVKLQPNCVDRHG